MSPVPSLVFLDLETTGLDPSYDLILEIGMVVTDRDLNVLGEFVRTANWPEIRYSQTTGEYEVPFGVNKVVVEMHEKSGLWRDSYRSNKDLEDCFKESAFWLGQQLWDAPTKPPMAGNTIGFDRTFIQYCGPKFLDLFHYRSVDVSSLRILYEEWILNDPADTPREPMPVGNDMHRPIPDCIDSIEKLKFFRRKLFNHV
jgi:oligoribonuclease